MNSKDFKEMVRFMSFSDLYLLSVYPTRFSLLRKFYTCCIIASLTDNVSADVQLKLFCFYVDKALISGYMENVNCAADLTDELIFKELGVGFDATEVEEFLKVIRDTDRFLNRQLLNLAQDSYETHSEKLEKQSVNIFNQAVNVSDMWLIDYCCEIFDKVRR